MLIELQNIKSVIFDFDYTLADSSPVIIECISYALGKMHLPIPSPELMRKSIGMSPKDALKVLIRTNDQNTAAEFKYLFAQREDEVMLEKTVLLDGVRLVLMGLDRRGLGVGIVSNKYRHWIEAFLLREKLKELIDVIVGFEDAPKPKPNPAGLLIALNKLGGSKTQTVYIGDNLVDAITAHRIRIPFIAVITGVTSKQDFKQYSPWYIVNNLQELLPILVPT